MGLLIETQSILPGKIIIFTINADGQYYFSLNNYYKEVAQVDCSLFPDPFIINPNQTTNSNTLNYIQGQTITFSSNVPVTAVLYVVTPNYSAVPFYIDLEYPEVTNTNTTSGGNPSSLNSNTINLSLILTSLENLNGQIQNLNNMISSLSNIVTLNSQGLVALSAEYNQLYTNQQILSGNVDSIYENTQVPLICSISS